VTDLVAEIAAASNEQAQGVSQITAGLGHVDQVTQQNTSLAEESASAAQELTRQAKVLQQLVSTFKVDERILSVNMDVDAFSGDRQRMLQAGTRETAATGRVRPGLSWGGPGIDDHDSEPVIHLDDRDFGKY
jgi:methyl-accepting chemotaxis protein